MRWIYRSPKWEEFGTGEKFCAKRRTGRVKKRRKREASEGAGCKSFSWKVPIFAKVRSCKGHAPKQPLSQAAKNKKAEKLDRIFKLTK